MSTPISERTAAIALLLLASAACRAEPKGARDAVAEPITAGASVDETGRVLCAPAGATDFAARCTLDRTGSERGLILTLRHPDGHFRRLLVTRDGRGVIAADGAEPARVAVLGADRIEVAIGGDRYRLPATIKHTTP